MQGFEEVGKEGQNSPQKPSVGSPVSKFLQTERQSEQGLRPLRHWSPFLHVSLSS
jgi:hypothetical protein